MKSQPDLSFYWEGFSLATHFEASHSQAPVLGAWYRQNVLDFKAKSCGVLNCLSTLRALAPHSLREGLLFSL